MYMEYSILGMLAGEQLSGYDLKKKMQSSTYMYWSGNNNQIYKALLQLEKEGYATNEMVHRDSAPSKKIYRITEAGKTALDAWILDTPPQLPEFRNPFLLQIAAAGNVNPEQLIPLLSDYKTQLEERILMEQEKKRRAEAATSGTANYLTGKVYDNLIQFYQSEWAWTEQMTAEIRSGKGAPT